MWSYRVALLLLVNALLLCMPSLVQGDAKQDVETMEARSWTTVLEDMAKTTPGERSLDIDSMSNEKRWLYMRNFANSMELKKLPPLQIPINVNLVFIGFSGKGYKGLSINYHDLLPWFSHLDHTIEHTIVTSDELRGRQTTSDGGAGMGTSVHYTYSYNVVELSDVVLDVLHTAMLLYSRPDDSAAEYQVNAQAMSNVLLDLTSTLHLSDAYTLFILNPAHPLANGKTDEGGVEPKPFYGYRSGLSNDEIAQISHEPHVPLPERDVELFNTDDDTLDAREENEQNFSVDKHRRLKRFQSALSWRSMRSESEEWARRALEQLKKSTRSVQEIEQQASAKPGLYRATHQVLYTNPGVEREMLRFAHKGQIREDCLVDAWVMSQRAAFIDLAAGPFTWGPVVGGEGVRTRVTKPTVPTLTLKQTRGGYDSKPPPPEAPEDPPQPTGARGQPGTGRRLMMSGEGDDADEGVDAYKGSTGRRLMSDEPTAMLEDDDWLDEDVDTADYFNKKTIQSERDMIVEYLDSECDKTASQDAETIQLCDELRDRLKVLDDYLKALNIEAKHVTHKQKEDFEHLELDAFLSKMGSMISSSIHHTITPSTSELPKQFHSRVNFHLYLVKGQDTYPITSENHFNVARFKKEMNKLKLPQQDFMFTVHRIKMSDDPSLAMAYSNSLKSSIFPSLKVDGKFEASRRLYLDSLQMEHHLRWVSSDMDSSKSKENSHGKNVFIFLFSLDSADPVFIDRYFQARSVESMVIAVQSPNMMYEGHLQCNEGSIAFNLRNPTKALMAATAQHLSGVIPSHISYSEAHQRPIQNWMWSVGDSPLAATSQRAEFGDINKDMVHRNYVAGVADAAIKNINQGYDILHSIKTTPENHQAHLLMRMKNASMHYYRVKKSITKIINYTRHINYAKAAAQLQDLLSRSESFLSDVESLKRDTDVFKCVEHVPASASAGSSFIVVASVMSVAGLAMLANVVRQRTTKTKIN